MMSWRSQQPPLEVLLPISFREVFTSGCPVFGSCSQSHCSRDGPMPTQCPLRPSLGTDSSEGTRQIPITTKPTFPSDFAARLAAGLRPGQHDAGGRLPGRLFEGSRGLCPAPIQAPAKAGVPRVIWDHEVMLRMGPHTEVRGPPSPCLLPDFSSGGEWMFVCFGLCCSASSAPPR